MASEKKTEVKGRQGFLAIHRNGCGDVAVVNDDEGSDRKAKIKLFATAEKAQDAVDDYMEDRCCDNDGGDIFHIYKVELVAASEPVSKVSWAKIV